MSSDSNLQSLCMNYIVRDARLTNTVVQSLPKSLMRDLLLCALKHTPVRDRALVQIIQYWPYDSLVLADIDPTVRVDSYDESGQKWLNPYTTYHFTSALIYALIEVITRKSPHVIRYLDISINYTDLSVITQFYMKCNKLLRKRSDIRYKLRVDLDLTESSHGNIWNKTLLKEDSLRKCRWLDVQIVSLRVPLGSEYILPTLDLMKAQPQYTRHLSLNYCASASLMPHIVALTKALHNLTSLSMVISHHGIDNAAVWTLLRTSINNSPCLARLYLERAALETIVGFILSALRRPLDRLSLIGCHLHNTDLISMSKNDSLHSLSYLDLSYNSRYAWLGEIRALLTKLKHTLRVLKLAGCALDRYPQVVSDVCCVLSQYKQLRWFDVSQNGFDDTTMDRLAQRLVNVSYVQFYA